MGSSRMMLVLIQAAALLLGSCGGEPDCDTPTEVFTAGPTYCNITFADVPGRQCFGAAYEARCTTNGDSSDCECFLNGALVGTCTNREICRDATIDNTQTILYVEQCCGWSIR